MIIELKKPSEKTWNDALYEAETKGTIFQSTYWAEFLRKTFSDRPIYVASLDNKGNIQGLLLAIESCYAKHPSLTLLGKRGLLFGKLYKHATSPVLHEMLPFIFWENGPVILSQASKKDASYKEVLYQRILEKIVEIAEKRNCYEIKFARPALFNDNSNIFSSIGFQKKKMGTLLVNLEQPSEVLWNRMDKSARKNIERTEQDLQIVKASKLGELGVFYDLNVQACKRSRQKIYPFSFFASLWNYLSPLDKAIVFIASMKDKPVGASLCLMHNEIIHHFALGDSDYARSNKIYANEALLWHIINWAKERNFKYFDQSGVEIYKIEAGDQKAKNIYRYKSKFGGQLLEYHDYQKILKKNRLVKFLNRYIADSIIHN